MRLTPLHRAVTTRDCRARLKINSAVLFLKFMPTSIPSTATELLSYECAAASLNAINIFIMCGLDKDVRFSNPYTFLARDKDVIEDAYPGDVVGLFDTGNFKIGDTLN